jgi:hypothetical protein
MTIEKLTRNDVKMLLDEAGEALGQIAMKHGIIVSRKSCTYDPVKGEVPVAFKFIIPERGDDGEAIDPNETQFRKLAHVYGLSPDDYNREFSTWDGKYFLKEIRPKAKKFPFIAECAVNGKRYKFTSQQVLHCINATQS